MTGAKWRGRGRGPWTYEDATHVWGRVALAPSMMVGQHWYEAHGPDGLVGATWSLARAKRWVEVTVHIFRARLKQYQRIEKATRRAP